MHFNSTNPGGRRCGAYRFLPKNEEEAFLRQNRPTIQWKGDTHATRRIVGQFVEHYNNERLHSAIGYIVPKDKLEGRAEAIIAFLHNPLRLGCVCRLCCTISFCLSRVCLHALKAHDLSAWGNAPGKWEPKSPSPEGVA